METKSGGIAVSLADDNGAGDPAWIGGYASTFGPPPDLGGDIVQKGAFRESILKRPVVPVLWSHKTDEPIGKTSILQETNEGLLFRCKILDTFRGEDLKELVREQVVTGVSIGFNLIKSHSISAGIRSLDSIDLMELSLCTFPMNERARLQTGKQALLDALFVASVENDVRRGIPIPTFKVKRYFDIQEKELERMSFGGLTRREVLADIDRQLQELDRFNS